MTSLFVYYYIAKAIDETDSKSRKFHKLLKKRLYILSTLGCKKFILVSDDDIDSRILP